MPEERREERLNACQLKVREAMRQHPIAMLAVIDATDPKRERAERRKLPKEIDLPEPVPVYELTIDSPDDECRAEVEAAKLKETPGFIIYRDGRPIEAVPATTPDLERVIRERILQLVEK
jgi:hypothetical protein